MSRGVWGGTGGVFFRWRRRRGLTAVTWATNRHLWLSRSTSPLPFLPRATPSSITTPPLTPWSGPSTSASDGFDSPQTSRFLLTGIGSSLGGVPMNFRVPVTAPPPAPRQQEQIGRAHV